MVNAELKKLYEAHVRKGKNAYQFAMRDACRFHRRWEELTGMLKENLGSLSSALYTLTPKHLKNILHRLVVVLE